MNYVVLHFTISWSVSSHPGSNSISQHFTKKRQIQAELLEIPNFDLKKHLGQFNEWSDTCQNVGSTNYLSALHSPTASLPTQMHV